MKRGFVLGKFMPVHEGHVLVFDIGCSLMDELTILVCSRDCEPIDGQLRLQWVQESVKCNAWVLHMHRDIPQEPSEHADFWTIWKDVIDEFHPESIDTVFGSDDYIIKLAEVVSARPFLVDQPRQIVPVSASLIRENPIKQWNYLPLAVRRHYQQRVCVLGPESTGKSVLCKQLAEDHQTRFIEEYGRVYDAVFRRGDGWSDEDFVELARGHMAISNETRKYANQWIFEDTDLLQTLVWAKYLLNEIPEQLLKMLEQWEPADHYLLMKPDIEWINDGTRYSGDNTVRNWFFEQLLVLLQEHELSYDIIAGSSWSARTEAAQNVVAYRSIITPIK